MFYLNEAQSHLENNCFTYVEHVKFSLSLSLKFFQGSLQAFCHAIIPSMFKTSSTDIAQKIQDEIKQNGCNKKKS